MFDRKLGTKRNIEKKQNRLNRLVLQGSITQQQANEQIRQYAKLVCNKLGE